MRCVDRDHGPAVDPCIAELWGSRHVSTPTLPGLEEPTFTLICKCAFCGRELARESYRLGDRADEREAYAFADLTLSSHARECEARPSSPNSGDGQL